MAENIDLTTEFDTSKLVVLNKETGEYYQINERKYGVKNFWKCYLKDFLAVIKTLSDKQLQVFVYIVENTRPSDNLFIGTYDKIIKNVKCCRQTVLTTMNKLKKNNFIRKVQNGVWMINPDVILKGNDKKRNMLLSKYRNIDK